MRQVLLLLLFVLEFHRSEAAQNTAAVSIHCLSVRLLPSSVKQLGLTYQLDFTTDPNEPVANNELALSNQGDPTSHTTYYRLTLPTESDPIIGQMFLDVPLVDVDTNDLIDFFEVSRGLVQTNTSGIFDDGTGGTGNVTATWSRSAGSTQGDCQLRMKTSYYDLTFPIKFQLLEFKGTLQYQVSGTNVNGSVNLVQTGSPTNSLAGPLNLGRKSLNEVIILKGTVTNSLQQALAYVESPLDRFVTHYVGYLVFQDWDLSTAVIDYNYWLMRIVDNNDSNGNGIPDLSDPASTPIPPSLSINRNGNIFLTITGESGQTYDLEKTSKLSPTNWLKTSSVTLTNNPLSLQVGPPDGAMNFWRLRVP